MKSPYKLRAKDVMTRDVVTVHPDDKVQEALALIIENRVSTLPVIDSHHRCVGILSTSDLLELTKELDDELMGMDAVSPMSREWLLEQLGDGIGTQLVSEQMTPDVEVVGIEAPLVSAAQMMLRNRVHHVPVVDGEQRLQGILSTMDILRAFAEGGE